MYIGDSACGPWSEIWHSVPTSFDNDESCVRNAVSTEVVGMADRAIATPIASIPGKSMRTTGAGSLLTRGCVQDEDIHPPRFVARYTVCGTREQDCIKVGSPYPLLWSSLCSRNPACHSDTALPMYNKCFSRPCLPNIHGHGIRELVKSRSTRVPSSVCWATVESSSTNIRASGLRTSLRIHVPFSRGSNGRELQGLSAITTCRASVTRA